MKPLREVAFDMEDIMDEYMYILGNKHRGKFGSFLHQITYHSGEFSDLHHIGSRLEEILTRLHHLRDMKDKYGIITIQTGKSSNAASERRRRRAETSLFLNEDEIVGFEKKEGELVEWLKQKKNGKEIISVWGTGGVGKTTLVTKVYRRTEIQNHFVRHAWVVVSQNYIVDDLLRGMVKQFSEESGEQCPKDIDTMDHPTLVSAVRTLLSGKSYIIILDDVWSTDVWDDIKTAFSDDEDCGGKIVLTTRIRHVASLSTEGDHIMELKGLKPDDAQDLFIRRAFKDGVCPESLHELVGPIVDKCEGLPLAIVAMGSLLSLRDREKSEWQKVIDDLNWELNCNYQLDQMKSILTVSFKDLPEYCKNCFLYCSIFPKASPIKRNRLIRLWISEGFIERRGGRSMEEIAGDILNELVHRCMLQVVERNDFGRVRTCRMHDIMRELTLSICEKDYFCAVYESSERWLGGKTRRLSVHKYGDDIQAGNGDMVNLRSFIYFDTTMLSLKNGFKILRVLELQGVPLESLPESLFDLFNLHYLGLRNTRIKRIPESIQKLINLQTLDLAFTRVERLPPGIRKLRKLRNLFVHTLCDPTCQRYDYFSCFPAPRGIWDLKELQTLQGIEASEKMVKQLRNMVQLQSFRIIKVRAAHCAQLCAAINKMKKLHRLDIVAAKAEGEALELEDLSPFKSHLQKLTLRGQLSNGKLPTWFTASFETLAWLRLGWSGLTSDPLPALNQLPNLVFLLILNAFQGEAPRRLCFESGHFKKLKDLQLLGMSRLKVVQINEGSLPSLRLLSLVRCGELEVPKDIQHLTNLEKLYLEDMPKGFKEQLPQGRFKIRVIIKTDAQATQGRWDGERRNIPPQPEEEQQEGGN